VSAGCDWPRTIPCGARLAPFERQALRSSLIPSIGARAGMKTCCILFPPSGTDCGALTPRCANGWVSPPIGSADAARSFFLLLILNRNRTSERPPATGHHAIEASLDGRRKLKTRTHAAQA